MDSKKLAFVLASMLALTGCGDDAGGGGGGGGGGTGHLFAERDFVCADGAAAPCETTANLNSDDARRHELPGTLMSETRVWVVRELDIPQATGTSAAGFNLDGLDSGEGDSSGNCEELAVDYTATNDPGHIGVDNALAGGLGSALEGLVGGGSLGETVTRQVCEGELILMVEVSGIDDLTYDDAVQVQLVLGTVLEDADPATDGNQPMCGSDGLLTADQNFGTMATLGAAVTGDIYNGRLRAQTPMLPLNITAGEETIMLTVNNAEVRVNVADGSNGAIGGFVTLENLAAAAAPLAMGIDVGSIVGNFADVNPTSADPNICDALSVGLTFTATTATRTAS